MTQAEILIREIRRSGTQGLTYGDLQALHVSTSPQKRLAEAGHKFLELGERLSRRTGADGLVRFVIARARKARKT